MSRGYKSLNNNKLQNKRMLTPREASRIYTVSRATLMRKLKGGIVTGEKDDGGRWLIDQTELARLWQKRSADTPDPGEQLALADEIDQLRIRLAMAETQANERGERIEDLKQQVADLRRLLPPADEHVHRGRRWWRWWQ